MPNFKIDQKKLVFEIKTNNTQELVRTTKQWIHLMNKRQCETDFMLLQQSLRQIHKDANASAMYNFGPTVMRMLHYLNLPDHALKLNHDLQIGHLFDQLSCTLILCDMLFNNAMYKEILQVLQKKRSFLEKKGMIQSRFQNYVTFAACYKLNTKDSLDYGLEIYKNLVKEHQLSQSMNFLAMLAINQDQPATALDVLVVPDRHFSSINVRLIALSDCGQYAESSEIVKNILNDTQLRSHRISEHVIQRIRDSLDRHPSTEDAVHYNNLLNELQQQMRTSKVTIDEMLCWPLNANWQSKDKMKTPKASQSE
ncbi:uncharacterized protein LOC129573760 [Sitodiplosis mosellana]|uniref:uncharacterized protein LOC129573760 n=1 Tax=Sitodiplosis mosellana TaxID=263140 RepID=UPI0024452A5F|nr:uncharacterized protein LOC129573760 [Sitodiplosis mosellana]